MAKRSAAVDREIRIELLRARAALERQALALDIEEASHRLSPGNALREFIPGLGGLSAVFGRKPGGSRAGGLAIQAYRLWRQYPIIGSTVSALALGGSRKARVVKAIVGGVVAWKLYDLWQSAAPRKRDEQP
ncbi:MAG: hypothetical protein JHC61_13860 [Burkholderiaceae bacterium]|nr:hypothetical protein [Burkholderiaceae bacterium]